MNNRGLVSKKRGLDATKNFSVIARARPTALRLELAVVMDSARNVREGSDSSRMSKKARELREVTLKRLDERIAELKNMLKGASG